MKIGVEIGGTFTDLILAGGDLMPLAVKVPSTPDDPSRGALFGISRLLELAGIGWDVIEEVLHGSTVATNALIERKGAKTGLVTTAGFEDVLLIGRQEKTHIYDAFYRRPAPLVPRTLIRGVPERIGADGQVLTPLDEAALVEAVRALVDADGVRSLAIVFLHAYRNAIHERRAQEILSTAFPALDITISSDIAPEFREYERTSTAVINAYVRPLVRQYVARMSEQLGALGYRNRLMIMQSNGGVLPADVAAQQPVRMFLSGPAAGVTGAVEVARRSGSLDLITMDIGGTSCDVSIISGGHPEMISKGLSEYRIDGNPINIRMIDIATIGAGGGSIAWIDDGGLLRVGPLSAGAQPGPACYGRGGTHFTVTDALMVLGLIDPKRFIGGEMRIVPELSEQAAKPLCERLKLSAVELARSVFRITVTNIAQAVRQVTVQRGRDPRDYAMLPYGGGGSLFAAAVAEELGITRVLVPRMPGIFSAFGLTAADMRLDFTASVPGTRLASLTSDQIEAQFSRLEDAARHQFASLGAANGAVRFSRLADARYVGQGFELTVPVGADRDLVDNIADGFHQAHADRYGHSFRTQQVELVGYRVEGIVRQPAVAPSAFVPTGAVSPGETHVRLDGGASWQTHERDALAAGATVAGPAIIFEATSAVLVPALWALTVDDKGNLNLQRDKGSE